MNQHPPELLRLANDHANFFLRNDALTEWHGRRGPWSVAEENIAL